MFSIKKKKQMLFYAGSVFSVLSILLSNILFCFCCQKILSYNKVEHSSPCHEETVPSGSLVDSTLQKLEKTYKGEDSTQFQKRLKKQSNKHNQNGHSHHSDEKSNEKNNEKTLPEKCSKCIEPSFYRSTDGVLLFFSRNADISSFYLEPMSTLSRDIYTVDTLYKQEKFFSLQKRKYLSSIIAIFSYLSVYRL